LDHLIKIKITNTYDPGVLPKRGEGIGLRNIKERLQTLYNNPGLMKIENKNNIFAVTLYIPQNV
jgi:two-component system, LytTR family, sensor kinase